MTTPTVSPPPGACHRASRAGYEGHTFSMRVPARDIEARCVGRFRHIGGALVASWGLSALVDDVGLLISELVTNAMTHGAGDGISLVLCVTGGALRVEVTDGSQARPRVRDVSAHAENGRGMIIVNQLADAWGVSEDGRTVWCSLALPRTGLSQ
ncbi:ATP-binding protein [Streptomyces sp. NPDC051976]|uniref:ATP-binding protein n=1 Tax=Streptomyces sp. NPDC051976 TaxID=3154947 RepID=UPI00341D162A